MDIRLTFWVSFDVFAWCFKYQLLLFSSNFFPSSCINQCMRVELDRIELKKHQHLNAGLPPTPRGVYGVGKVTAQDNAPTLFSGIAAQLWLHSWQTCTQRTTKWAWLKPERVLVARQHSSLDPQLHGLSLRSTNMTSSLGAKDMYSWMLPSSNASHGCHFYTFHPDEQ